MRRIDLKLREQRIDLMMKEQPVKHSDYDEILEGSFEGFLNGKKILHVQKINTPFQYVREKKEDGFWTYRWNDFSSYVQGVAHKMSLMYANLFPEDYEADLKFYKNEVITDTCYSYAKLHVNHACLMHRDRFKKPGNMSSVYINQVNASDGYLVFPELRVAVKTQGEWAVFLEGHNNPHGVTPIKPTNENGFRISLALY